LISTVMTMMENVRFEFELQNQDKEETEKNTMIEELD